MTKNQQTPDTSETDAVDYRLGTPWDFGLLPDVLRRVAACTKARVARSEHWPAPQPAWWLAPRPQGRGGGTR